MWGRRDPYFAVLSSERHRGGLAREAFFASGEAHIAAVLDTIRARLIPGFLPRSALDFGCGVGRTTLPLARICATAGLDVSPAMLDEARRNAAASGLLARFSHEPEGTFDLVHSFIVFQHIPPARGLALARGLLERVNFGGVAVLHFTYESRRSAIVKAINWLRYRVPLVQYATNVARGRPLLEPPMQMNAYPLAELLRLFAGFRLHLEFTDHGGYLGCVFYAHRA